jgi:3-deoxy-D-manno-octulosonic-acid transferase
MFIIYDLIFLVVALIYLPVYLFKKKFHREFSLRLGRLPKYSVFYNPIWIHAVSVGEAVTIKGLLEELRRTYPEKNLVISTITPTGNKIARSIAKRDDCVTYLPLDFSFLVKKVTDRMKPAMLILAETEIWPNLISYLYKKNIPVVIVNGRISDASFRGYRCIKLLVRPILNKIQLFCVQSQRDAQRLECLGVSSEKIRITGNMKFDAIDYADYKAADHTGYKIKLGLTDTNKLLVAASTHPGEEKIILEVYKKLGAELPNLKLLIAPRHPERCPDIEELVKELDFMSQKISLLDLRIQEPEGPQRVFILDTIGELVNYYAIADIVFVGGSLVKTGGHNILEPASLGKAILFGPHMFNFRDIADLFLNNAAARLVRNPEELKNNIKYLLGHPEESIALGQAAQKLILQNRGATRKNLEHILPLVQNAFFNRVE